MSKSITRAFVFGLAAAFATTSFAQTKTFKVGIGNPTQQIAQVESATELETFVGRTSAVTGSITADFKKKTATGKIAVEVKSIETGLALRDEHMRSAQWLDAEKYPQIVFEAKSVKQTSGDNFTVTGTFTLHGVTKTLTVPATVKYRAASSATAAAGFKGDILLVKSSFSAKLADYGIKVPAMAASKVASTVKISITVYAQTGA